ncbi:hypothetical protein [Fangia hongkongensis]|uniref:hypothetical protein n=1 Tax=Fangia hongkongensis TaxID=270495 RepID=UPI000362EAC9|nr:hypothetical protein [Fangia hongkongensis]
MVNKLKEESYKVNILPDKVVAIKMANFFPNSLHNEAKQVNSPEPSDFKKMSSLFEQEPLIEPSNTNGLNT